MSPPADANPLLAEIARAEQIQRDQEAFRDALKARAEGKAADERRTRIDALAHDIGEAEQGSEAADRLLPRVMEELAKVGDQIAESFQDTTALRVPRYTPSDSAKGALTELKDPEARRLAELHRSLAEEANTLETDARRLAADELAASFQAEDDIARARVQLLEKLSDGARYEALGVTPGGLDQLRWEGRYVKSRATWYARRRDGARDEIVTALRDPFTVTTLATRGALVLAAIVAVIFVNRRRKRFADALWGVVPLVIRRPRLLHGLERARDALLALTPSLLLIAVVWGIHRALGPAAAQVREVELVYSLLLWYTLYRLALTAAHRFIAARAGATEGEAKSAKILRSLRMVGRYALGLGFVLTLTEIIVGRGYIHNALHRVAWIGWIAVAWALLGAWRGDICDAYLARRDTGMLAEAVRKTRRRWSGFFVGVLAFTVILLSTGASATRRFVLSFDQAHRVLAFIFRKRLERLGDAAATAVVVSDLPEELRRSLSEDPLEDPRDGIDYFPGIDRFEASIAEWKVSHRIGALLLVGGAGSGKTTWLRAAERRVEDAAVLRVSLSRRLLTAEDVITTLADELKAPPTAREGVRPFALWLRSQPRSVIVIDDLEHLFLRGLDTWAAWEAFLEIVEGSRPNVFWLCALAHHPHRYLLFARGSEGIFRVIVRLLPWSEQRLTELLRARVKASGHKVSFEDLVVDKDSGAAHEERAAGTEREFMRLLWDYSQGAPRVALHFWLRSLVPTGEQGLRVRLFNTPTEDALEALTEQERFVLASVIWHDSLTTEEAAISLGYPRLPSRDALAKLVEMGVIDDLGGRHRVTMRWQRAVTNFLLRKHLIQP